jgi:hypothetical protein
MRDIISLSISLDTIVCHDEGDGWGSAEPYLWTVFFKIDGSTVSLNDSLNLMGTATIETTPGSHDNLGDTDVDEGDTVSIPNAIGFWETNLIPIPVPQWVKDTGTEDLPAVAGVICVLMEEDNVSDSGANAGHDALNAAVQSALDSLINSLGFSHQEVTDGDIDALTSSVQSKVEDAVKNNQNIFENIWSWLNPDDTIGTVVFRFDQDALLSNGTTVLNKRWKNEGDWELNGAISASVVCTASSLKALAEIFNSLFSDQTNSQMREFRIKDLSKYRQMHRWWQIAERNTPQLMTLLRKRPELLKEALMLHESFGEVLSKNEPVSHTFWKSSEHLLNELLSENKKNRRVRKDITRALQIIQLLKGKTRSEVFEILNTIPPARHPGIASTNGKVRMYQKGASSIDRTEIKELLS